MVAFWQHMTFRGGYMNQGLKNLLLILGMGTLPVSLFAAQEKLQKPSRLKYQEALARLVEQGRVKDVVVDNVDIQKFNVQQQAEDQGWEQVFTASPFRSRDGLREHIKSYAVNRTLPYKIVNRQKTAKTRMRAADLVFKDQEETGNILYDNFVNLYIPDGAIPFMEVFFEYGLEWLPAWNAQTGDSLLHTAAQVNQLDSVLFMLSSGFDALYVNKNGKKASDLTTHADIKRVLLEAEMYEEQAIQKHDQIYDEMLSDIERDVFKKHKKKNKNNKDIKAQAAAEQAADDEQSDYKQAAGAAAGAAQEPQPTGAAAAAGAGADAQNQAGWQKVLPKVRLSAHEKQINGRWYTKHALERMAPNTPEIKERLSKRAIAMGYAKGSEHYNRYIDPRAVMPAQVEEVIKRGSKRQYAQNTLYDHNGITVVLGADDAVVTVIRTS